MAGRPASARFVLALAAAAVLAFSGCGGDSSTAGDASTTASGSTSAEAPGAAAKAVPGGDESERSPAPPAGGSGSGHGGKHGPKVAIPKGERERGITPQQRAHATVANILLTSPALKSASRPGAPLPAAYTCDGKNSWPELRWSGIPSEASELVLLMANLRPVDGALFFDWAVAGLDPSLDGIEAGHLPKGAIVGRNSTGKLGYSVCPPQGERETYVFMLFALPKPLNPQRGFDPLEVRKAAGAEAANAGLLAASYSRG